MNRALIRPAPLRAAAAGLLALAFATGCSAGSEEQGDATDAPGIGQEEGDADAEDPAASGGGDDQASDGGGAAASDGWGETAEDTAAAAPLPADADLATEALPVPAEEAVRIATEAAGGGDLVQIDIDHEDGSWQWEVELAADTVRHDVTVDATTGDVVEQEQDDEDEQDPIVDVTTPLAWQDALDLAVQEVPGAVSGWVLDSDDGVIAYEIDIEREDGGDVDVLVEVESSQVTVDD
ncbi:peptidase [Brachybacterium sp. UMB0905]|nr:peptidase [Brachybacterium sp. UMB0905]